MARKDFGLHDPGTFSSATEPGSRRHLVNCSYERAERRAGHRSKAETNATRPEVRAA